MKRRFVTLDVFTTTRFAGNPLAVVLDGEALDDAAMLTIAREFNLSETVFVQAPSEPRHRAKLRIFTPGGELPFAGHPTVGTAVILALRDGDSGADARAFGLEEKVGVVPCIVERKTQRLGYARFRLPRLPEQVGAAPESADIAQAIGLEPDDIGFARHKPMRLSAGNPFDCVPLRSLSALSRMSLDLVRFNQVFGQGNRPAAFFYTAETGDAAMQFRARMFAPGMGIGEDPATGSAVAAFAGALMAFEPLGSGQHNLLIGQGYEMGRPSQIELSLSIEKGRLAFAEIGGHAIVVSEGKIEA